MNGKLSFKVITTHSVESLMTGMGKDTNNLIAGLGDGIMERELIFGLCA